MHDYGAINDACRSLVSVLEHGLGELRPAATAEAHRLDDTPASDPARITVFLYEVNRDPHTRNAPTRREGSVVRKAPIGLVLRFLLTPWGGDLETEQHLLGRTLQIINDHAIIAGHWLKGGLADSDAALKLTDTPISLEDRTRIWQSVQQPYRLSITVEMKVVRLQAGSRPAPSPVRTRDQQSGGIEGQGE